MKVTFRSATLIAVWTLIVNGTILCAMVFGRRGATTLTAAPITIATPLPDEVVALIERFGGTAKRDYPEGWASDEPQVLTVRGGKKNDEASIVGVVTLARRLNGVRALDLSSSPATDAALAEVAELKTLQYLNVMLTNVTDDGLKYLTGLTELRWLRLDGTKVTDVGLKQLEGMPQLQVLGLAGLNVTNAGLSHIEWLTHLTYLDLAGTKISDDGLLYLKDLKQLNYLRLSATAVTDAGLQHLRGLSHLRWLQLDRGPNGPDVSEQGIKRLRNALPNCRVAR